MGLNPAQMLVFKKQSNIISESTFNQSWDSLKLLNNESQLNMLMQNTFNQNHTLSVFGSVPHYNFSAIGTYGTSSSNALGNNSHKFGLNLNNDLKLLDDRLRMQLYVNLTGSRTRTGTTFDPNSKLQPYQMLLDNQNNYVYDYANLSQDVNKTLMEKGYHEFGTNLLEDARNTNNRSNLLQAQARLNIDYNVFNGFQWATSVYYTMSNTNVDDHAGKNTSRVRNLVNTYGEYTANGINFYVPYGDIMSKTKRRERQLNVRTALSYSKTIGKHRISASIGGGGYLYSLRTPAYNTMYGYNFTTETGTPIFLPSSDPKGAITNYTSLISGTATTAYPYQLLNSIQGDSTNNRNLNVNAGLGYSFNSRIFINGTYTNVYNPNYGQVPTYSTLSTLGVSGTYRIIQRPVESWFNKLDVSTSYSKTQMPDLPTSYTNLRYYQNNWGNYSLWVNGYLPSQQGGQKSEKISETLTSQFWNGHFEMNVAINTQKRSNMSSENSLGEVTWDSSSKATYVSAGAILNLRNNLFRFNVNYNKSPEGNSQVNGDFSYDIGRETYFKSKTISSLIFDMRLEDISPMQGLGLMMETNRMQASGNFSYANNGNFNSMPPKNTNFEMHSKLGIFNDKYYIDLRYYNHSTSGVSSYVPLTTDPSTGLSSQYSYSLIKNKGVEFYLQGELVKTKKFSYVLTINGAYNVNIAKEVPTTNFTMTSNYVTAYRNGYNTASIWSYR